MYEDYSYKVDTPVNDVSDFVSDAEYWEYLEE